MKRFGFLSLVILFMLALMAPVNVQAKTKTVKKTVTLKYYKNQQTSTKLQPCKKLKGCKNIKVKSSDKSIATAKCIKAGFGKVILVEFKDSFVKKGFNTTVNITVTFKKNGKARKYIYKVWFLSVYEKANARTNYADSKKAFKIQNQYRKAVNREPLKWSDDLYAFCIYRLKTSGYDKHKYSIRDRNDFFGPFLLNSINNIYYGENQAYNYATPEYALKAWKNSTGHYENIIDADHKYTAVARLGNLWISEFIDGDISSSTLDWKNAKYIKATVKKYDAATNSYVTSDQIKYYNKENRLQEYALVKIRDASEGGTVYVEKGKTYRFYETITNGTSEKAESIDITIDDSFNGEIILSNASSASE